MVAGPRTPSAPDAAKGKQAGSTTLPAKVPPPAGEGAADKSWVELDPQAQAHAATLGYDAATWDAKELPPGCASRWDADPESVMLWEELPPAFRLAAVALGYNYETWDNEMAEPDLAGGEQRSPAPPCPRPAPAPPPLLPVGDFATSWGCPNRGSLSPYRPPGRQQRHDIDVRGRRDRPGVRQPREGLRGEGQREEERRPPAQVGVQSALLGCAPETLGQRPWDRGHGDGAPASRPHSGIALRPSAPRGRVCVCTGWPAKFDSDFIGNGRVFKHMPEVRPPGRTALITPSLAVQRALSTGKWP